MRYILVGAALAINTGVLLAAETPPCPPGDPWVLPPSKPKDLGQQFLLRNLPQAARIRVCNCTAPGKADSYVNVNTYRAETQPAARPKPKAKTDTPPDTRLPNPNLPSRLYAGSCIDAGGTDVQLTNVSETAPATGTYSPR